MSAEPELQTHPLAYVVQAANVPSEDWLRRRLNRGEIRGRRAGKKWSMTTSDIAALIAYMAQGPEVEAAALIDDLTPTSRRRLKSA